MELLGTLAMTAGMGVMLRRAILETGIRCYNPAWHRMYCRREGTGAPVVLLHGLGGSWRYWRRGLNGLTGRHALYIPDLLGFGRSPKPRGHYGIAMHVDGLTRLLDEIEGDTVIVGHSMGAILALAVYACRPSQVSRLVLIGLPYFPTRDAARAYLARQSLMNRLTLEWPWMAQGMCYMKDFFALPVFAPLARMPVDLYRDYWKHTWCSVSRSIFNTLLAADVVEEMREVDRARITLVHGRADSVAPIEHIRQLVAQFPELRLREVNSGHHPYLVYPRLLNRIIAGEEAKLKYDR